MIANSALAAFIATTKPDEAKAFYRDKLGLKLVEEHAFAIVFDSNGTQLRVQKAKEFAPHPFTAVGWNVEDIAAAMADLASKGVAFEKYPFAGADGVWTAPDGTKVAWFKDPDGNTLSLAEFPKGRSAQD